MDQRQRRELGAHYTSEENILKVINPLCMDSLWHEFALARSTPRKLDAFHQRIAELQFLDPACGCGNFLIVAYRELRRLELEIIKVKLGSGQRVLSIAHLLKVRVGQFHGIEIEEFPCQVAKVGMWLVDHQMNTLVSQAFGRDYSRLPLKASANLVCANALTIDWTQVVPTDKPCYVFGNPPFSGARLMTPAQKNDMRQVFGESGGVGNLDYVTAWYWKAAALLQDNARRVAYVSTNSLAQGEQPALLWEPLYAAFPLKIDFAYRTFKWSNAARGRAVVHCVIIGFSNKTEVSKKTIYDGSGQAVKAKNINPYLTDAPDVFIKSRSRPLCAVPVMGSGNQPIDGGNYLFSEEEKAAFVAKEPRAAPWFRPWIGSEEFIQGQRRYCLWLGDCPAAELRRLPEARKRVEAVRRYRLASRREGTRKIAATPRRFHFENMPQDSFILIPEVSTNRRQYIPMGFLPPDVIASNLVKILPGASLYHFGILTSSVHMAWTNAVCGRLGVGYRYSVNIVYNNFPWPETREKQQGAIATAAEKILATREKFPESSLAELYDPLTMPGELRKSHNALDRLVLKAYGFIRPDTAPDLIVACLMRLYQGLSGEIRS
jgi:hypothetical protein